MRVFIVAIALAAVAGTTHAQDPAAGDAPRAGLRRCVAEPDDEKRLLCYDALALAVPSPTSQTAIAPTPAASPSAYHFDPDAKPRTTPRPAAAAPSSSSSSGSSSSGRCWVNGYTTKKGKRVAGYYRKC